MQTGNKANPNVNYTQDAFRLNGGLDLITPKVDAANGSLLDCLNREVVDRIGYKKIDGYEVYNGRTDSFAQDFFYVDSLTFTGTLSSIFPLGTPLVVAGSPDDVFGIVVEAATLAGPLYRLYFLKVSDAALPAVGEGLGITPYGGGGDFVDSVDGVRSCALTLGEDATEVATRFNGYFADLRLLSDSFAGSNSDQPPHGLHWFRDRLYAVCDDDWIYFDSGGTTQLLVNQFIGSSALTIGRVTSVQLESGTWAGGDAKGIVQIAGEVNAGWTDGTNLNTYATEFGTLVTTNILTVAQASDFTTAPEPLHASLWASRSIQQSIDEEGSASQWGWYRIDHGWEADFEDGLSAVDALTVVERGSDNNFTFTSGDEEGLSTQVLNGTNLIGTPFAAYTSASSTTDSVLGGYPGWKTNASTSVFADSDAIITAIDTDDANFVYANIWYYGSGVLPVTQGDQPGRLVAFDNAIYGPVSTYNSRANPTVTGATFQSDFFTTQARAPLIFNDLSAIGILIPANALIQGAEVVVEYDSQHYGDSAWVADRNGASGADVIANTITWVNNNLSLGAQFCRSTSGFEADAIGAPVYVPVKILTTAGSYNDDIDTSSAAQDLVKFEGSLATQTSTLGSSTNLLGADSISRDDLLDSNLGIALFGQMTGNPLYPLSPAMTEIATNIYEYAFGVVRLKIDKITLRFHYTVPSARYFVSDPGTPANVCTVDLVYYAQRDGSFSSSTASGAMQFTNLIENDAGVKRTVASGDAFYLTQADALAAENAILTVASDVDYNGIPALNRIVEESSRYEFITANFFGRDEWDGFYGVSGAGRAFSFATYNSDGVAGNEDYVVNIVTNTEDEEGDIPRHVAYHHNSLALGYRSGIVRFSVPGEPENYSGVFGAAEVGIGDRVTGLLSMRGTTLGVFCENSIWGISGTDVDNYQSQVLAPYTGAIEYTVVDMGIPVYCDSRGISTLEQSEKYGDFVGNRLSKPVTPWITPRMTRNIAQFSGIGAVCAIPVRSKSQYRVFFNDGKVLVMTITPDQGPVFTFSEYTLTAAVTDAFIPLAWSSQVDNTGVERLHFSHFAPNTIASPYVYEFDRGWGFEGNFIPSSYTCNWFYKDPFSSTTAKKIRLDGLTYGLSSCSVFTAKDYDETFNDVGSDISIPRSQVGTYTTSLKPATNMANIAITGRNISFKVVDTEPAVGPIPPDVHQMMMLQFDPGGKIDA